MAPVHGGIRLKMPVTTRRSLSIATKFKNWGPIEGIPVFTHESQIVLYFFMGPNPASSSIYPVAEKVLSAAAFVSGDAAKASSWYTEIPIECFGGQTAQQLVAADRGEDVLRYLSSLEAGATG